MQQEIEAVAPQTMDVAVKPPAERAALVLGSDKTELELKELVAKSTDIVAVIDPAGREQAHRIGMTLKGARVAIEKTGKAAREDATAYSKAVVSEEKRLIAIVTPEEERVLSLRDQFDAKVRREKEEAERIEAERKAAIRAKIEALRDTPAKFVGGKSADIGAMLGIMATHPITEREFAEFVDDAQAALDHAGAALHTMYLAAQAVEEAERQRLLAVEQERVAIARQAEANRVEAERIAALKREHDLAEAERARKAAAEMAAQQQALADAKAEQERVAAESKRQMEEQQRKINADRAELEAKQAEMARQEQERAAKAETERLAAIEAAKPKQPVVEPVVGFQPEAAPAPAFPGVDIDAVYEAPLGTALGRSIDATLAESIDALAIEAGKDDLREAVKCLMELDIDAEVILAIVQDELMVTA